MVATFDDALSRSPLTTFQWATVLVCMLVLICDGIDMQMLGLIAPVIIEEWGIDRGAFGPAMSAALIGMALGAWSGGWLGDRIGRRGAIAIAALFFGLATIAASQSDGVWSMAGWRVLGGLGFGAAFPNTLSLASEWLPERWRPYAITTLSVGTPAGGFVAAALAPAMLEEWGWRGTFVAFGAGTLLLLVFVFAVLRESPQFHFARGRADKAREVASRVVGGGMEIVGEHDPVDGQGRAVAAVGVFDTSNRRLNIGVGLGFAACTLVAYGVLNWGTSFLTAAGFSMEQALHTGAVVGLTSVVGALAAGWLIRRFGSRAVMGGVALGVLTAVVGLAVALEWMPQAPGVGYRLAVHALAGSVSGIVSTGIGTIYVIMTMGYPQACRGSGIGFGMLMGRVGGILASFFGGTLIDWGQGSLVPFFAAMILGALLISTASLVVDRHVPPARS